MKRKNEQSTRELMGTKELSDYSIRTYRKDELVYFLIQPSNLSVLSEESLSARIYGLMTVLKGITEIEMMCLNSRENFEDNKRYLIVLLRIKELLYQVDILLGKVEVLQH